MIDRDTAASCSKRGAAGPVTHCIWVPFPEEIPSTSLDILKWPYGFGYCFTDSTSDPICPNNLSIPHQYTFRAASSLALKPGQCTFERRIPFLEFSGYHRALPMIRLYSEKGNKDNILSLYFSRLSATATRWLENLLPIWRIEEIGVKITWRNTESTPEA